MTKVIELNEFQKKFFIEREPIFQKLIPLGEIIDIKWLTPKNPTFIGFHNEYEIHFFKRGSGIYFVNGIKCEVQKNSMVIIKPKQIHYFIPEKKSEIEKGTIYFSTQLLEECGLKEKKFLKKQLPCNLILTEEEEIFVEMIFKTLLKENTKKEKFWKEIIVSLMKILFLFIERLEEQRENKIPIVNPLVRKILDYIEKNFTKKISIEEIAEKMQCSVSHISHLFKKNMGLSIKQYIIQRRIAEAKYILENEIFVKMSAIAERVGFSNFALFNKYFKRMTGITPAQYQKFMMKK